jgi:peptidoglycan-N-acetylglucosamine deacetylase
MVAFTFDDGPDPAWTPRVLDALAAAAVKATFFVVAEQIEGDDGPALLRLILDRGHAAQMHCGAHTSHQEMSLPQIRADAQRIETALEVNHVAPSALWRPPYGLLHDEFSCRVASERGRQLVLWTYDTADYVGYSADTMLKSAREAQLSADSVVLMHDSRRYAQDQNAQGTVDLIEPLAAHIRSEGWEIGPPLSSRIGPRPRREGEELLLPCP